MSRPVPRGWRGRQGGLDLAVAAQQRAYQVLLQRGQASIDELKAVAA